MTLPHADTAPGATRATPRRFTPALLLVVALAVFVRAWDLQNDSMWIDEILAQPFDPAMTYEDYRAVNLHRMPDNLPLYYVCLYALFQMGAGPFAQRLFGIALGAVSCAVLGLFTRRAYGNAAGLIAAALYALSPYYAHMDQALRPYPLVILLAMLSLGTASRYAERQQRRWLAANTACNALLLTTHLVGAFQLIGIGFYLLRFLPRRFADIAAWGVANFICAVAAYMVIVVVPPEPLFTVPTLKTFLANLVADDFMWYNPELLPSSAGPVAALVNGPALGWAFRGHAMLAAGVFLLAMPCAAWRALRNPAGNHREWLFLSMAVTPLLAVAVLSFVNEPMHLPRYTLISSAALYVMAAAAITRLPRFAGAALLAVLFSAYAVQAAWFLTTDQRTQSLRVIDLLSERRQEGDPVMVSRYPDTYMDSYLTMLEFRANAALRGAVFPVCHFYNADPAARRAAAALAAAPRPDEGRAWLVLYRQYDMSSIPGIEAALARHGLAHERHVFDAMKGIVVYEARLAAEAPDTPVEPARDREPYFGEFLARLGVHFEEEAERRRAFDALATLLNDDIQVNWDPVRRAVFSCLAGEFNPALALALADDILAKDDGVAFAWVARGSALLQLGREAEAAESFRRCLGARPDYYPRYFEPLLIALADRDFESARALAARAYRHGAIMPPGLVRFLGVETLSDPC